MVMEMFETDESYGMRNVAMSGENIGEKVAAFNNPKLNFIRTELTKPSIHERKGPSPVRMRSKECSSTSHRLVAPRRP